MKAAALMWASEAAFGNTEVAAPKILGDIVESLVGAVYIDSHQNFEKTWLVRLAYLDCMWTTVISFPYSYLVYTRLQALPSDCTVMRICSAWSRMLRFCHNR